MFRLSQKSLQRLEGVHEDLRRVVEKAITITTVDFGVVQGLRTVDQQRELYAQGRTKPGKIVTWTMRSDHLTGRAVDLGAYVNGKYIAGNTADELELYYKIADAMLKAADILDIKISWGVGKIIDGKPEKDFGHFALKK